MRTNEERAYLIQNRVEELRKEEKKRRRVLSSVCMAACFMLIIGLGAAMPDLMADIPEGSVAHTSGAASLIAGHEALGYILIGLISFLLGVFITILLFRLRDRTEQKRPEDKDDEL